MDAKCTRTHRSRSVLFSTWRAHRYQTEVSVSHETPRVTRCLPRPRRIFIGRRVAAHRVRGLTPPDLRRPSGERAGRSGSSMAMTVLNHQRIARFRAPQAPASRSSSLGVANESAQRSGRRVTIRSCEYRIFPALAPPIPRDTTAPTGRRRSPGRCGAGRQRRFDYRRRGRRRCLRRIEMSRWAPDRNVTTGR